MSNVKEAAKVARGHLNADRPLGKAGIISGDTLVIAQFTHPIVLNGKRECIRPMIGGKRRRLYLDDIELIADLLSEARVDLLSTTTCSIGELACLPKEVPIEADAGPETPGLAYLSSPLSLQIAALRSVSLFHSTLATGGDDPLSL